ncbi:MAG: ABC transporter permease subunit [Bacilli bacterium]|nr:ABC transporter permease subunit [Bacilli bacterium]
MSAIIDLNNMIFPSPYNTFKLMFELLGKKSTYRYLGFSIIRLIIGFSVSFALAFLLGIIVNNSEILYNFFTPVITFLKAAPTATFVFLFIVLFGGRNAPAFVVVVMCFPILYESVVSALRSTSQSMIDAAQIDGAGKFKTLMRVQIPLGMPFISLGLLSTFGMAFKVEIMAEIITGITKGGIGTMIKISNLLDGTDLTAMFAYSLMAIILVLIVSICASIFKSKVINPRLAK